MNPICLLSGGFKIPPYCRMNSCSRLTRLCCQSFDVKSFLLDVCPAPVIMDLWIGFCMSIWCGSQLSSQKFGWKRANESGPLKESLEAWDLPVLPHACGARRMVGFSLAVTTWSPACLIDYLSGVSSFSKMGFTQFFTGFFHLKIKIRFVLQINSAFTFKAKLV